MRQQQWQYGCSLVLLLVYGMTLASQSDALLSFRTTTTTPTTKSTPLNAPFESFTGPEVHFFEPRDDGVRLSYRVWKAKEGGAKPSSSSSLPVLLIHPVGIGQGAWYWDQLCQALQKEEKERSRSQQQRVCYALNLSGCGLQDGGAAWNDAVAARNKKNDNNPYSLNRIFSLWVQDCQAILQQCVLPVGSGPRARSPQPATSFSFDSLWQSSAFPWNKSNSRQRCHVVVQGGLAPLGLLLAALCPDQVASLVLTSPPSFKDATTPLPPREIDQNVQFLTSKPFGDWALTNLEHKWAIELFSNLFLFHQPCDATWIQECLKEARPDARPPVQAFNAGECQRPDAWQKLLPGGKSVDTSATIRELIQQPVLIVQGQADTKQRKEARLDYPRLLPDCRLETLVGKSVVPWESPEATMQTLLSFWQTVEQQQQQQQNRG